MKEGNSGWCLQCCLRAGTMEVFLQEAVSLQLDEPNKEEEEEFRGWLRCRYFYHITWTLREQNIPCHVYLQICVWRWGDLFWPFNAFSEEHFEGNLWELKVALRVLCAACHMKTDLHRVTVTCFALLGDVFVPPLFLRFHSAPSPPSFLNWCFGGICGSSSFWVHATKYGIFHFWNKYVF